MERFENRWSNYVKIVTYLTILFFFVIPFLIYSNISILNLPAKFSLLKLVLFLYTIIFFSIVVFLCWYFSVKEYLVGQDGIIIVRQFGKIYLKWDDILDIKKIDKNKLSGSKKVWGNGGVFGVYGYFKNKIIGKYKAYFADYSNLVLIVTKDGKNIIISPDNSDFFIDYIKNFLKK